MNQITIDSLDNLDKIRLTGISKVRWLLRTLSKKIPDTVKYLDAPYITSMPSKLPDSIKELHISSVETIPNGKLPKNLRLLRCDECIRLPADIPESLEILLVKKLLQCPDNLPKNLKKIYCSKAMEDLKYIPDGTRVIFTD